MTQEHYAGQRAALQFHEQLAIERRDAQMATRQQPVYDQQQYYNHSIFPTDPPALYQSVPLPASMLVPEDATGCCGDGASCSCGNDCACNNCAFHSISTGVEDRLESDVHAAFFGQDPAGQGRLPMDFELFDNVLIPTTDEAPDLDDFNDAFPGAVSDNEDDEDLLQEIHSAIMSTPMQAPSSSVRRPTITKHITPIHRSVKEPVASHESSTGQCDDNTEPDPGESYGSSGKQKCCSSRMPPKLANTNQLLLHGESLDSNRNARVAEDSLCTNAAVASPYATQDQAARPSDLSLPSWPDMLAASESFDFAQFLNP